ncbi:MAG: amidohydrolase family protein, partial [Calditrichaeota bacterium]|nr:amidohydrolase family protein [Calditrichota bacterium]
AQTLGLVDRGLLREGYWADVTLFDPTRVRDRATWGEPHQYPEGIPYVIVNGEVVIDQDNFSGRLAGKALRMGKAQRA